MLCDKVISREKKCERKKREYRIRPGRTKQWWLEFLNDEVVADEWKKKFQMSKQLFLILCKELRQYISKNTIRFRKPISVEMQVAVTMYIFLTRIDLEKLQMDLELLKI